MRELFQIWPASLTDKRINDIIEAAHRQPEQDATIFASPEIVSKTRVSAIRWLSEQWLQDLLWQYVSKANVDVFNIEVGNKAEMQFTEYNSKQRGHYDWHHDVHWNGQADTDRKLSVTIQLSDTSEYEGGDFEFDEVKTTADFRSKGTVLVFPSYLRHRVLPLTSGTRRSLVAWFFGPRWK